jgi:ankyrin repeat protein
VCQLDTLGKCRTRFMLRNSLSTLPPTLDETYDRILRAIDQDDSEYALRILQWLAFSARPLLVEEISEVVAIDPDGNPAFNSEKVLEDPLDVLNICSSLVVTAVTEKPKQGKAVLLAHYSVKEYLISERCRHGPAAKYSMQEPACNEFIAKSCLGYLLQFQSSDSFSDETIENSKLAQYSAEFWTTHAQAAATANTESLNRMIMKLFSTKNDAYHNWIRIHDRDRPWRGSDVTRSLEKAPTSLYYSSSCGLTEITSLLLLEAEVDVNTRGGAYGTALQAASAKGDDEIVERLLRAGADVNAQDGFFGTALQAASRNGYKRIVDRLLGAGADVNTQDGLFGTALQAASVGGHDEIVERLLKAGADVNAQHGYFGTALQAASAVGHDGIVERLLRAGADVNAQDGYFGTALQAASAKGHDEIVEQLLRAGADVNARDGYFGTALQAASAEGHDGIVEQLLRAGAVKNTS